MYIGVDVGGTFDTTPFVETNFVVLPHQREVLFDLPDPMVTESLIKFMDNLECARIKGFNYIF